MDFETGLRLVKFRGEAMQEAAEAGSGLARFFLGTPTE